jgi:hypothetical protein
MGGWHDDLKFDPLEFLERPAVLIPRPRINLVLYYEELAPRSADAAAVACAGPSTATTRARAIRRCRIPPNATGRPAGDAVRASGPS